jgi:uncharacterized membrane protein YsdA (DUF1294 family)
MKSAKKRRRGPDLMVKMIHTVNIVSWLILGIAFIIFQMSYSSKGSYQTVRTSMITLESGVIFGKVLLFVNFLICIVGMAINVMRHKRKTDNFRISLIVSALISLLGFILLMGLF